MSACAIVKGTQRNLFVVPTAGTFEEEDLKSLEEEADADPTMKGQLMTKLHVSREIAPARPSMSSPSLAIQHECRASCDSSDTLAWKRR